MSYEIRLIGHGIVEISDEEKAKKLSEAWEKYKLASKSEKSDYNQVFEVQGIKADLSEVKSFIRKESLRDRLKKSNTENISRVNREYLQEHKRIRESNDKHKRVGLFKLMYWAMTGKDPSKEDIQKAYKLQKKFFGDNPKRIHPDPRIFKSMININFISSGEAQDRFRVSAMRIVERVVGEDIHTCRKITA